MRSHLPRRGSARRPERPSKGRQHKLGPVDSDQFPRGLPAAFKDLRRETVEMGPMDWHMAAIDARDVVFLRDDAARGRPVLAGMRLFYRDELHDLWLERRVPLR